MSRHHRGLKYSLTAAIWWLAIAAALALAPMFIGLLPPMPAARSLWVEFGVMLGFLGMGLMCLQFVFSGRLAWVAPRFGTDNVQQFHRQVGIVGVIILLLHPLVLILAEPRALAYFDPRPNLLRALALSFVTAALVVLLVSTLWRKAVKLNYEWWRLLHGLLAMSIVFVGVVHGIQVGRYLDPLWKAFAWAAIGGGAIYLVIHTRLVRPWRLRRRPYRITGVERHRDDVTSITLEPDGHAGMEYDAGQFAWITVGDSPFSLQQHPFSFASAEDDPHLRFAAKAVGDFTRRWPEFTVGTRAFLEGPLGGFTRDPHPTMGVFLIMGGIGITPGMSLLRTMRKSRDTHPAILLYANSTWEQVTYRRELAELEQDLNLKVVHVLSDPQDGWEGEKGLIDQDMIARHLPGAPNDYEYFICGPGPMMDIAEESLRKLGVQWQRIYSERFQIV